MIMITDFYQQRQQNCQNPLSSSDLKNITALVEFLREY